MQLIQLTTLVGGEDFNFRPPLRTVGKPQLEHNPKSVQLPCRRYHGEWSTVEVGGLELDLKRSRDVGRDIDLESEA